MTVSDLARGDVLLFDLNCPHRTHVKPSMTKDRLSVDLRLVRQRPGTYRGELIPLTNFSSYRTDLEASEAQLVPVELADRRQPDMGKRIIRPPEPCAITPSTYGRCSIRTRRLSPWGLTNRRGRDQLVRKLRPPSRPSLG